MRSADNTLECLLGARTRTILIERLVMHPEARPWFRELCRGLDIGMTGVHRELQRLVGLGLVTQEREAGACFYRVDTEHILYEPLRLLAVAARAYDEQSDRPLPSSAIGRYRIGR
ncbi:MAG: helix-turn-helix transcriptional regulator [Actinomycetota bacterium]|jgi:DNA-binding transcriptional ArsR family regulator|nr:helix-turn-helix transcriptional regulator [Actinomycetota bacterium]